MDLIVHEVEQRTSGGSHVTIFEAELEIITHGVTVEILAVEPVDAPQDAVELARKAIQRGARRVLEPRGQGAVIRVKRVVIHPIDFKSTAFERYTITELRRLMS